MKASSDSLAADFKLSSACPHHHHTHLGQRHTYMLTKNQNEPHSNFILELSLSMDRDNHKDDSVEPSLIIVTTQHDHGTRPP